MFVAQHRVWSRRDVLDFASLSAFSDSATAERVCMKFNAEEFRWYGKVRATRNLLNNTNECTVIL